MADESYYWYKSHGICVKCKKNNASPNRIMCDECREKWNAIRREKSKNPEYKNWKKQYNKEHKEKMLENGLCPMCGKNWNKGLCQCKPESQNEPSVLAKALSGLRLDLEP